MLRQAKGFTLIELAVVLFLVTLVLGGVMTPLSTRIEQEGREKTEAQLQEIKEALVGYALVNGHLPCPDCPDSTTGNCNLFAANNVDNGIEDGTDDPVSAGLVPPRGGNFQLCATEIGNLPWSTLGVDEFDAWGRHFVYGVDQDFADDDDGTGCGTATAGVSFEICSQGGATIWDDSAMVPAVNRLATNIPVLVYSYGANGDVIGGSNPPTSANELENWWTDLDTDFIYADYNLTPAGEFDDLFIWISPSTLMYKMVTAERLP